jgi:hypothetical protein
MQDTKEREAYSLLRNSSEETRSSSEDIRRDHLPELSPHRHRLLRVSAYVHLILLIFNAVVGTFLLQKLIETSTSSHLIHCKLRNSILSQRRDSCSQLISASEPNPPYTRRVLESQSGTAYAVHQSTQQRSRCSVGQHNGATRESRHNQGIEA